MEASSMREITKHFLPASLSDVPTKYPCLSPRIRKRSWKAAVCLKVSFGHCALSARGFLRPPHLSPLETIDCDFKISSSSLVNWKQKRSGNIGSLVFGHSVRPLVQVVRVGLRLGWRVSPSSGLALRRAFYSNDDILRRLQRCHGGFRVSPLPYSAFLR